MPQYISADATKQLPGVVRLFKSYPEAALHGYHSLKRLKEMGLMVPDSMRLNYRFMVETKYGRYPVYSKDQCVNAPRRGLGVQEAESDPESPQNGFGETDQETVLSSTPKNTTTPSISPTPFDVQNMPSDVDAKDLRRKFPIGRSKGKNASCTAYFPTNFKAHDWAVIKGMEEQAAVVFDQLYKFRHVHGQTADEFVSLSWAYGRELIGRSRFDRLMRLLLKAKILERTDIKEDSYGLGVWTPRGQGTGLAYGYRFTNPDYRRNYSKVVITGKALQKRLKDVRDKIKYPVQKHLRRLAGELDAVLPDDAELLSLCGGDKEKAKKAGTRLKDVAEGRTFFSADKNRRLHSNLTGIKRGARKYLRVRGEPLWHVDLPCCHLLGLACRCLEAGVRTAEEFLCYCEGDFYRQLADEGGFTREEVKEAFTKKALNAPNRHRYQRSPVMRFFRKRWKWIAKYMYEQKANGKPTKECPKPHNKLALSLQRWEANLVVFRICDRIRRERPDVWIGTIHDAVVCLERDVSYVVEVTAQELKALGIVLAPGKLVGKAM
jgi:hypothetical protein